MILEVQEKVDLNNDLRKSKEINKRIFEIDTELLQSGAATQMTHDEIRYEFSEDDDEIMQLLFTRMTLVLELEKLSLGVQVIPVSVDVECGKKWGDD